MREIAGKFIAIALIVAGPVAAQAPSKSPKELRADSLLAAGNAAGALPLYQQLAAADSIWPRFWYGIGMSQGLLHHDAEAAAAFERASANGKMSSAMYNAGAVHARMGHTDLALGWLEKAVNAGFQPASYLSTDIDLVSLRGNPRFQAIVQKAAIVSAPCEADPNARRFDFWIGEWDVTPAGVSTIAGHSLVQKVAGGCALLENWTANGGGEGKSLNTYNVPLGQWEQFWVGQQGGVTEYRESHWDGPTLVYRAHSQNAQGPFEQRLSFTPVDPNTVRQFGELSFDGGKTWQVGYDFYYHRKK